MIRSITALLLTAVLLAGCESRLPALAQPSLRTAVPLSSSAAPSAVAAPWPEAHWWERYGDAELNALITRALQVSPTLAAATARQAHAVASLQLQAADNGLRVNGVAQQQRLRLSDNGLFPPELLGVRWYSLSQLGLDINYQTDLGRRHAEALRAAGAEERAVEAERAELGVNLAASVAQLYYTVRADAAAVQLARQTEALSLRNLDIASARRAAELSSGDEVRHRDLELLAARDASAMQGTGLALHRAALAALLDLSPEQLPDISAGAPPALPLQLPAGSTLGLVARRGDLSAARWRVESSHANAAVAHKGYVPDFSLRAFLGLSSVDISNLLYPGSAAHSLTAALALPLYDAGAVRARFDVARTQLDGAISDYNATLLTAAREVNEALLLRASAADRLASGQAQITDVEELRAHAEQQLQRGLSDARPLLLADLQLLQQRAALLQAQRQLFDADLALIRALGGGYEDKSSE